MTNPHFLHTLCVLFGLDISCDKFIRISMPLCLCTRKDILLCTSYGYMADMDSICTFREGQEKNKPKEKKMFGIDHQEDEEETS